MNIEFQLSLPNSKIPENEKSHKLAKTANKKDKSI